MDKFTYLNAESVAKKLDYSPRYFKEVIVKNFLEENVHYIRGFGGRKLIFIWEKIEEELLGKLQSHNFSIPMSSGGFLNG